LLDRPSQRPILRGRALRLFGLSGLDLAIQSGPVLSPEFVGAWHGAKTDLGSSIALKIPAHITVSIHVLVYVLDPQSGHCESISSRGNFIPWIGALRAIWRIATLLIG
jgi:hypothetical protein